MPGDKFIGCVIDYSYKGLLLTHEGCLLSNRLKNTELGLVGTKRQQAHHQTILLKTEILMTDKNIHCWFIACSVGMRTKRSTRSLISSVRQDELYSGTVAQIQEIPNRFGCPAESFILPTKQQQQQLEELFTCPGFQPQLAALNACHFRIEIYRPLKCSSLPSISKESSFMWMTESLE